MSKHTLVPAVLATLLCALSAPALSQTSTTPPGRADLPRGYVDYYAAGTRVGDGSGASGFGARLMVRLPAPGVLDRVAVGAYAAHLPTGDVGAQSWEYGAQTDLYVLPALRRVDPLVTLGLGAVHLDRQWGWSFAGRPVRMPVVLPRTGYALAPGVGARLRLLQGLGLRADVRHAFALDRNARAGTEVTGGISLPL